MAWFLFISLLAGSEAAAPLPVGRPLMLELKAISEKGQECALDESLVTALRNRLPFVFLVGSAAASEADLSLSLNLESGAWKLSLTDSRGATVLRRSLTIGQNLCRELAEACSMIVERFLQEVEWNAGSVILSRTQAEVSSPPLPRPRAPPPFHRFSLATAAAAIVDSRGEVSPGWAVETALRLSHLHLAGRLLPNSESEIAANAGGERLGFLTPRRLSFEFAAGACAEGTRWRLCGGPLAGVARVSVSARGSLYQFHPQVTWIPRAGGFGRLGVEPWAELELSVAVTGAAPLRSASFTVEGTSATYSTAAEGGLWFGVGWLFF